MLSLTGTPLRRLAGLLGFPPGTGELIDQPTRRRLLVSVALSALLAVLDAVSDGDEQRAVALTRQKVQSCVDWLIDLRERTTS